MTLALQSVKTASTAVRQSGYTRHQHGRRQTSNQGTRAAAGCAARGDCALNGRAEAIHSSCHGLLRSLARCVAQILVQSPV